MKLEPKQPRGESISWYSRDAGPPNAKEMTFFALLVVKYPPPAVNLADWATRVMRYHPRYISDDLAGLPVDWKPSKQVNVPAIYAPIASAPTPTRPGTRPTWHASPRRCTAGTAMARAKALNLTAQKLHDHNTWQKSEKIKSSKHPARIRWKTLEALFGVAELVQKERRELQRLLDIEEDISSKPSLQETVVMQRAAIDGLQQNSSRRRRRRRRS